MGAGLEGTQGLWTWLIDFLAAPPMTSLIKRPFSIKACNG